MSSAFPDARTLIIAVVILTSLAIAINNPLVLAGLLAVTLLALVAAKIPLGDFVRRFKRFRWLIITLALVQSLTNPHGQIYWQWREYILLSSGGLWAALAVLLRLAVILAGVQFLNRKNYQELVTGMVQMKVPYELAYMVLLGIRFIPVFMEEFRDALTAMALRGVDLEQIPWRDKLRVYSYILMPTVAGAMVRARRIATAMEARAFRAYPQRTWLEWPRLSRWDWALITSVMAVGFGILALNWRGII